MAGFAFLSLAEVERVFLAIYSDHADGSVHDFSRAGHGRISGRRAKDVGDTFHRHADQYAAFGRTNHARLWLGRIFDSPSDQRSARRGAARDLSVEDDPAR